MAAGGGPEAPYIVVAEIVVKPEHFAAAREAVAGIVADTRREPGCEVFRVHVAIDGSPRLFLYERWRGRAAFDHHHAQAYTKRVFALYEQWLAEPPRLTVVTDLA